MHYCYLFKLLLTSTPGSSDEIFCCVYVCDFVQIYRMLLYVCLQGALGSGNEILRCAAGEALGRIVQVVGESKFIADMAQYSFDRLPA